MALPRLQIRELKQRWPRPNCVHVNSSSDSLNQTANTHTQTAIISIRPWISGLVYVLSVRLRFQVFDPYSRICLFRERSRFMFSVCLTYMLNITWTILFLVALSVLLWKLPSYYKLWLQFYFFAFSVVIIRSYHWRQWVTKPHKILINLKEYGYTRSIFLLFRQGWQLLWLPTCFTAHQPTSEKVSTL